MRDSQRETQRQRQRCRDTGGGERSGIHAGSPLWDWIPGPPGSRHEPKAEAQPLKHPGVPEADFFEKELYAWSGQTEIGRSELY